MSDRKAVVELDGGQTVPTHEPPERTGAVGGSQGVRVTGLFKSFSSQPVLRGVDLDVPVGSFTAILGPSGSGKTTLLRILAGFDRMDAGSVVIGGQVMDDGRRFVRPQRRGIGYVPQEGALFPHLTVADNVGFGVPRSKRKGMAHLVEMVGLTGLERRYPHQLSGGQQQRVALARALAIQPKVVLLDEPFSSLDASLRDGVRRDVAHILAEANATTILVTHDQDEALGLADQIAVLNEGSIVATADPARSTAIPPIWRRPSSSAMQTSWRQRCEAAGPAAYSVRLTLRRLRPVHRRAPCNCCSDQNSWSCTWSRRRGA